MRRPKRAIQFALILVLAVGASGCVDQFVNGGDTPESEAAADAPDAQTLQRDAVAAMDDVDSYSYDLTSRTETGGATVSVNASGVVDRADRRLRQTATTRVESGAGTMNRTTTTYLVDGTMYFERTGQWQKLNLTAVPGADGGDVWNTSSRLDQQRRLLADANVSVEREGTTTVDGVETYVLSVDLSEAELQRLVGDGVGATGGNATARALEGTNVSAFRYTHYVAKETNRPVRTELVMNATVRNPRTGERVPVNQTTTMTFDDFGEEVSIDLPPAAANATSVGAGTDGDATAVGRTS